LFSESYNFIAKVVDVQFPAVKWFLKLQSPIEFCFASGKSELPVRTSGPRGNTFVRNKSSEPSVVLAHLLCRHIDKLWKKNTSHTVCTLEVQPRMTRLLANVRSAT